MTNLNSIKALILIMTLFSFAACQNQEYNKVAHKTSDTKTMDTISIEKFQNWTSNWTRINGEFRDSIVRSFTMPIVDLTNIVGEKPAKSRFYLGVDTLTTPVTPHLMVVGVNAAGQDMIDYSNGLYIYDVSTPCPPICGI